MFEIEVTSAGPDFNGNVHLMESGTLSLCGKDLTGDVVADDCDIDCLECHVIHSGSFDDYLYVMESKLTKEES